jgi:DNA-directed RNA polymerase subunit RPC12/RpoP
MPGPVPNRAPKSASQIRSERVEALESASPTSRVDCPECGVQHLAKNIFENTSSVYSGGSANTSQGTGSYNCPTCAYENYESATAGVPSAEKRANFNPDFTGAYRQKGENAREVNRLLVKNRANKIVDTNMTMADAKAQLERTGRATVVGGDELRRAKAAKNRK